MNEPSAENSGVSTSPLRRKSQSFSSDLDGSNDSDDARQLSPSGEEEEGDGLMHEQGEDEKLSRMMAAVQQTWNWKILAFGQLLSLLLACQGFSQSSLHLVCSLSAPTFATGIVYVALLFNLVPIYLAGRRMLRSKSSQQGSLIRDDEARRGFAPIWFLKRFPLHASPWAYLGIAILDVEANYATVMSFKYTTLTSAAVFDNMAIPSAMVLSRLFLKRKYVWLHLVGVMICLGGITVNVLIDYKNDVRDSKEAVEAQHGDQQVNAADVVIAEEYPHRLLGDILAIVGGLLFGARDVLTEKTIRQGENSMEYLGMVGLFGTMISTVQVLLVERQAVTDFFTSSDSSCAIETGLLFLLSYVVANILRYFGTARFLLLSEAALLNLSLLTGDLWSALFSIIGEKIVPPALFWLALVLILSGVLVYEIAPSPIGKTSERIRDEVTGDASGCDFANPEGELEIPKISRAWIERI